MRTIVATLLGGILLVGCGTDAGSSPTPASTPAASVPPQPSVSAPATASPSAPSTGGGLGPPPSLDLEPVVGGLDSPLDIAWRPDEPGTMFVVEQAGRIRIVRDGTLLPAPFLDIADMVQAGGERGLLGLAFSPTGDGRFFVYYTALDGRQIVAGYDTSLDGDTADRDSERIILAMDDPFGNHNGGALAFGPDGFLYISTGDGGGGGDPLGSGRSFGLLAKVRRLDIVVSAEGDPPYAIPADNPFVGRDGARPEIWHTGLRNPWRMRFDAPTGDLWIADVGQGAWEEIDVARAGAGGLDFGWNTMEGTHCYGADSCDRTGLTLPVAEYGHDEGCSVTGGAVHRGADADLRGWYGFADYCSGRFWVLDPEGDEVRPPIRAFDSGRSISAIAVDPAGELFATDLAGGDLLRIVAGG